MKDGADMLDKALDWVRERTTHTAMNKVSVGAASFSYLDFADNVALLSELVGLTFGLPRGGGTHPKRFFRCHTFCIWNKILTFQAAIESPFAHI